MRIKGGSPRRRVPPSAPAVTVTQSINDGDQLSASLTWTVTVTGGSPSWCDFRIDGVSWNTDATIPFSEPLDTLTLVNGVHEFQALVYDAAGVQIGSASASCTVYNVVTPPGGGGLWPGWGLDQRPAFTPTRQIVAASAVQLQSLLNGVGLLAGDKVVASNITMPYQRCTITARPASWAEFHLTNVIFPGSKSTPTSSPETGVEIVGAQNLRIYGGEIKNPNGGGLNARGNASSDGVWGDAYACKNITWFWDMIHQVAQGGAAAGTLRGPVSSLDFRGPITDWWWGQVSGMDPHNTKGSGLHAGYFGASGGDTACVTDSKFVIHCYDVPWGGGVQWTHCRNCDFYVQAENLTYRPPSGADGTGGAGLQPFYSGGYSNNQIQNCRIKYYVASNCRKMMNNSGGLGPGGSLTIEYARGTGIADSPAWDHAAGQTYVDVSPLP